MLSFQLTEESFYFLLYIRVQGEVVVVEVTEAIEIGTLAVAGAVKKVGIQEEAVEVVEEEEEQLKMKKPGTKLLIFFGWLTKTENFQQNGSEREEITYCLELNLKN